MSTTADQELQKLKNTTDHELMKIYASQMMGGYPQQAVVDAIGEIMDERKIKPGKMIIAFNYEDSKGNEKILTIMEV